MVTATYDSDYLEHHGILGQKWGVRRYQNEDGSVTPAGAKRYYDSLDGYDKYQKYVTKKLGDQNTRANAYAAKAISGTLASKRPSNIQKALYTANVVRITKKDNKKEREDLQIKDTDSKKTKIAKTDYNNMSDLEFRAKYQTSKDKFAKRVEKYDDPYKAGVKKAVASTVAGSLAPSREISIKSGNQRISANVGGIKNSVSALAKDLTLSEVSTMKATAKGKIFASKINKLDTKISKLKTKKDFDVKSFDAITEDLKYKNGKTFYSVADAKRDQQAVSNAYDKKIEKLEKKRSKYD